MTEYAPIQPGEPLESAMAGKIRDLAAMRNAIFVFPSQVSADSWAEATLRLPGIGAIETDRFIGWDAFLDRITRRNVPEGRRKADPHSRLIWALATLEENSRCPFLRCLVKPGSSVPKSLAVNLSKLASTLRELVSELKEAQRERYAIDRGDELSDYAALADAYARFLDSHGLYEPARIPVDSGEKGHFILFEPSLMPAYRGMAENLERNLSIEIFGLQALGEESAGKEVSLQKFASFREELQWVFAACASLIDGGIQPAEIAISIPASTPDIQAHIGLVAQQYCLPLDFRSGETLSASSFGRLLNALSLAASEGFSLRSMRSLFDRNAFGWKDEGSVLNLLRFAAKYNIPEFSADRQYMSRLWSRTLSLCRDPEAQASAFYALLKKASLAITGAVSFDALRRALHDFKDGFLEEPGQETPAARKMERLFEELDGLESCHSLTGHPQLSASPLEALLLSIETTRYRPAGRPNAISVYPYHLAALLASPIHLVLDASQASLDAALGHFSLIPKDLRSRLGETDAGTTLLSSFNSVKAVYCHAERSLSGYTVPHPYFSRIGALQTTIEAGAVPELPDAAESRAWRDSAAGALPAILPAGRRAAALGFFNLKSGDENLLPPPALCAIERPSGQNLDPELLLSLPACDASPLYKISPGKLKNLAECPFKWLLSCVPSMEVPGSAAAILAEGSLTHAFIREVLQEEGRKEGSFLPRRIEEHDQGLKAAFRRSLMQVLRENGPALEPAMEAAYQKIRDRIGRILDFEMEFRDEGWGIGDFEVPLSRKYLDLGLALHGRADRISERREKGHQVPGRLPLAIIDYKKNNTPLKKEFLIDKNGKLRDFQVACYAAMLEGEGFDVELGFYWSIETSKPVIVFGTGGARPSSQAFEPERKALAEALAQSSRIIREGSFMSITPSGEACSSCTMRPVCRAHFSSERL
jgi:hypothetical protein